MLFSIGLKGGQELSHETFNFDILGAMLFGIIVSIIISLYTYFILRRKLSVHDSGAIAASYGSVSAVTFVTSVAYLETLQLNVHGYMVAIMVLMESPAIIIGLMLISFFDREKCTKIKKGSVIGHSLTNGSVLLILGSLVTGFLANAKQAEGIKPFTNDLFKGFLAIFLMDMGLTSDRKLKSFFSFGWFSIVFAFTIPLVNGVVFSILSGLITNDVSNRFMFGILAASASYIAVPAAMKITVPKANPGLYLPIALAITFPVNITIGMPLYMAIVQYFSF